jgi:CBS domain-containing protein
MAGKRRQGSALARRESWNQRRATMQVKDIMTQKVETVKAERSVSEAARSMKFFGFGALPVTADDSKVVGMITDRDIALRITAEERDPKTTNVRDVMTTPVVSCDAEETVEHAARLMAENQVRQVLILDSESRPNGILSLGDVALKTENEALAGEVLAEVSKRKS